MLRGLNMVVSNTHEKWWQDLERSEHDDDDDELDHKTQGNATTTTGRNATNLATDHDATNTATTTPVPTHNATHSKMTLHRDGVRRHDERHSSDIKPHDGRNSGTLASSTTTNATRATTAARPHHTTQPR